MPSLTMTIVCVILGLGGAYAFYGGIYNRRSRYWLLIPFVFGLFFLASIDLGEGVVPTSLRSIFLIALIVGLMSTPLDD